MFADRVTRLLQGHGRSAAGFSVQRTGLQGCPGCVQQVEDGLESPILVWVVPDNFSPLRTELGLKCQHHELVFNLKKSLHLLRESL